MYLSEAKSCSKCSVEKSLSDFYKGSSRCKVCAKQAAKDWYRDNKESALAASKATREKDPAKCTARAKEWAQQNRERSRQIKAEWKKRNPQQARKDAALYVARNFEKVAKRKAEYSKRNSVNRNATHKAWLDGCPSRRLNVSIGNGLRDCLRGRKNSRTWQSIVGYSLDEVMAHLESLFKPGMSWGNYGSWHIDHIRPVSSFDFSTDHDAIARRCWALENLQPLWAEENLRKGCRWDGESACI